MLIRMAWVLAYMLKNLFIQLYYDCFRPGESSLRLARVYREWAHSCIRIFGVDVECVGSEFIPDDSARPLVVMSNHQSQMDIPVLAHVLERPLGFVAKKELSRFPILNLWMRRVGCVFIDRTNRAAAREALAKAATQLEGKSMVIFPEGTRSRTGELLPLKVGSGRLAILSKARIVPVRIDNSRNAFESRDWKVESVTVKVKIYPPLDTLELPANTREHLPRIAHYVESCWKGEAESDTGPQTSSK